ncbi:hypothetical protein P2G88_15000 [Aliiglaciecola sp. CAU 1673]|nr:hypothetical protein [Aliiglaciecola sp. CAU 1673]MDF2179559.1 hypothetical protein [Aliiglaciecola sp. CAU 1673]
MHHDDQQVKDPFNGTYFLIGALTMVALPLLHVLLAWTKYFG